jgi:superfamily I DNA and RNA helicase
VGGPGSKDRTGIYYKFCQLNRIPYYDFKSAQSKFRDREFQGACTEALAAVPSSEKLYDAILVDEAQDFPPEFLKLCYELLRAPKRLVYAYDELQKGNEAAMVYIINADDCSDSYFPASRARGRSQLFTAITRSKAWVRVLGVGAPMDELIKEYNAVKAHDFRLDFNYPNEEERKLLHIINRDMTQDQKKTLEKNITDLDRIVDEIDNGRVNIEDLPPDLRRKLRKVLGKMK